MTIAQLEGKALTYGFSVNKHGHIGDLYIKTENGWFIWTIKPFAKGKSTIKTLKHDHDEFEGLASLLGIDPETKESDL